MARLFDGTDDALQSAAAINIGSAQMSISFWISSVFAADDDILFETSANSNTNEGAFKLIGDESSTSNLWYDHLGDAGKASMRCASLSDSTYHHVVVTANRAAASSEAVAIYVDGVSQSLTRNFDANNTDTFGNFVLNLMSRNAASLFADGSLAEVAIWAGTVLGQSDVDTLYNSGSGNLATAASVAPSFYWRILGDDSPEPEFNGGTALNLIGAPSQTTHPFTVAGRYVHRQILAGVG